MYFKFRTSQELREIQQMVEKFKESGHPVFKSISALSRGILKRKNNRNTIHFNADASNTELLFRTLHSATQLSIFGAFSSWCEEFGQRPNGREPTSEMFVTKENEQLLKNVKPQEVNSLVQTPRCDDPASRNRLRECPQNFETLCIILEKSLYCNVLRDHCRRR